MSELEDEGVRAILRRLDALEPVVKRLDETVAALAKHGGCWTYVLDGERCEPVLAGQDFSNTVGDIRKDLARLRLQVDKGRWDRIAEASPDLEVAP